MENTVGSGQNLERIGGLIIRYSLVIVLFWIGCLKFTGYEAMGIKPLVEHSPLMSWGYNLMSVQGFAILIGVVEIILAILIAIRPAAPKASIIGSWGVVIMSIITLTFLFSTPGIIQPEHSFPLISPMPGQFLLKDLLMLGAGIWTAGEASRVIGWNRRA